MKGFTTKAIHGSLQKKDPHGSLRVPVYDSVAFEFEQAADMQQAFEGRRLAHSYTRISNPTVAEFEDRVRLLAEAAGVIAVSSGMAAIANVVLALAEAGSHVVTSKFLFGNTYSLFEQTLKPWGLAVSYVDMTDLAELKAALNEKTRAVFLETITNPQLQVADIRAVAQVARAHGVPVIVDGTMTTPWLFKSKDFGVAVEVISSTKCMSGGATSVGGLILDNGTFDWKQNPKVRPWVEKCGPLALLVFLRREIYRNLGACLAPHNAYLQIVGLETMALRMQKSCENARQIARWLSQSPKVSRVHYPGLESSPYYAIARSQFSGGFGSLLNFHLTSRKACFALMDQCQIVRRATNIHDNKTLILHPASTIFCEYSLAEKSHMEVTDDLLRLSVGIEDVEDIIEDLAQAMENL
jgi:O-acetylhomoserine (thiol)-lyase